MTSLTKTPRTSSLDRWINVIIVVGSAMFVFGLAVSAIFSPEWRVLHVFQALIYVAVVVLTWRKHPAGFGAGLAVALFWNILLITNGARDVVQEVQRLIRTGHPQRPDLLVTAFAACGHMLIIIGCIVGLFRMRPTTRQWIQCAGGGIAALAYLMAIVFTLGPPQAVELMKHVFSLK